MKLRLKALLLAIGLTVSSLSAAVCAEETEDASETEAMAEEDADAESNTAEEEYYIEMMEYYLNLTSGWTDDEVEAYLDSEDPLTALVALNWNTIRSEIGSFIDVTEITEMGVTDNGFAGYVTGIAEYDEVSKGGTVYVTLSYEYVYSSDYGQYLMELTNIEWSVDYTLGAMMQKAALNTIMGVCIVFFGLLFLSFVIRGIHYIPNLIDNISGKNKKKEEPETVQEASAVPEAAAVVPEPEEEISPEDDSELIAVIAAAIAAASSEKPSVSTGDAYVVRSIKKINNRNWRRA